MFLYQLVKMYKMSKGLFYTLIEPICQFAKLQSIVHVVSGSLQKLYKMLI